MLKFQDSPDSKKRVEVEDDTKGEVKKEKEVARMKKKNRGKKTYHMCVNCRKGILIVE